MYAIRSYYGPFNDNEVHEAIKRLEKEAAFINLTKFLFPDISTEQLFQKLLSLTSIKQFQSEIIYPFVMGIIKNTTIV